MMLVDAFSAMNYERFVTALLVGLLLIGFYYLLVRRIIRKTELMRGKGELTALVVLIGFSYIAGYALKFSQSVNLVDMGFMMADMASMMLSLSMTLGILAIAMNLGQSAHGPQKPQRPQRK